jgi:farnesyl diphosphate synthase
VVEAAEAFKGRRLDDSEYQKAVLLGWIVVFVSARAALNSPFLKTDNRHPQLHSYFSVSDDIIDQVTINHGKLSWHRVDGVGSNALNDALLLEGAVYQLAREHFRQEPYYVDLLELLHEIRHPAYFRNPVPVSTS